MAVELVKENRASNRLVLTISLTKPDDIPTVEEVYREARAFQLKQSGYGWPVFSRSFIAEEIAASRHFKLVDDDNTIAGVFSIVYTEPVIWNDTDESTAIYLHRMAILDKYRGHSIARLVIDWAIAKARRQHKQYVRMDTWADNKMLTQYYQQLGFTLAGKKKLPPDSALPAHYNNIELHLFEIDVYAMDKILHPYTEVLHRTPSVLYAMLKDLPEDWIYTNEGDNTWNIHQVVRHLMYTDQVNWLVRIKTILSDADNKNFPPFDRFGFLQNDEEQTMESLLKSFTQVRQSSLFELKSCNIRADQLQLTGQHPEFGPTSLEQVLSSWAAHDLTHLAQITRLIAGRYKNSVGPFRKNLSILK